MYANNTTTIEPTISNDESKIKPLQNKELTTPNVLLIEDVPIIQTIHKRLLEKLNCHVDVAATAEEALKKSRHDYDIILMDVGLPGMSGIEVTSEIRRREDPNKRIPIVVVTGFALEETKQECLAAGANEVVFKPVNITRFQELLTRWAYNRE